MVCTFSCKIHFSFRYSWLVGGRIWREREIQIFMQIVYNGQKTHQVCRLGWSPPKHIMYGEQSTAAGYPYANMCTSNCVKSQMGWISCFTVHSSLLMMNWGIERSVLTKGKIIFEGPKMVWTGIALTHLTCCLHPMQMLQRWLHASNNSRTRFFLLHEYMFSHHNGTNASTAIEIKCKYT